MSSLARTVFAPVALAATMALTACGNQPSPVHLETETKKADFKIKGPADDKSHRVIFTLQEKKPKSWFLDSEWKVVFNADYNSSELPEALNKKAQEAASKFCDNGERPTMEQFTSGSRINYGPK